MWDLTEGFSTFISILKCSSTPPKDHQEKATYPLVRALYEVWRKISALYKAKGSSHLVVDCDAGFCFTSSESNYFNGVGREIKNTQPNISHISGLTPATSCKNY